MLIPQVMRQRDSYKELIFDESTIHLTISEKIYHKKQIKLFQELIHNFSAKYLRLTVHVIKGDSSCAVLGKKQFSLNEKVIGDHDYELSIDEEKITLHFHDNQSFAHAFCTVLQLIEVRFDKNQQVICTFPVTEIADKPVIKRRMLHLCVFSENSFRRIQRTIREAGFFKYSHVVLEFWGMYKFKCCKDLNRKNAFTKKQIKVLVDEAVALGVQIVPMFNIWGHASLNRGFSGKHTVLDNNPKMQPYFSPTGWVWNIQSEKVVQLQKQIIDELVELFKGTEYFHLGCDEADTYGNDRSFYHMDSEKIICDHINLMNRYIREKGLKTLIWGDMLLSNPDPEWTEQCIYQNGASPEQSKRMLDSLDKNIIIVDWQYFVKEFEKPIASAKFLKEQGFEVMLAPWEQLPGIQSCAKNVADNDYYGFMQTTWHTLPTSIHMLAQGAASAWEALTKDFIVTDRAFSDLGAYKRMLLPPKSYKESGYTEDELERH